MDRLLAEKFGGHLSFFGGIDVRTLIANDRKQIAAELERKIPAVLRQGCGNILRSDHSIPPEVDYETPCYFFKRGREIGTWKKVFGAASGAAAPKGEGKRQKAKKGRNKDNG